MRKISSCLRPDLLARVAAVALVAGGLGACSSDTTRFGEDPFANPFSSASSAPRQSEPRYTGTVHAAPTGHIERRPLSAPIGAQARPMRGFDNGGGSYRSSSLEPRTTGSIPSRAPSSNWSAQGGSVVTLGQGDTIHTLAMRYGVPASAIMQANNLQSANGIGPGQQLVIPVYSANPQRPVAAAEPMRPAPAMAPAPVRMAAAPAPAPLHAAPAPRVVASAPAAAEPRGRMQFVPGPQAVNAPATPVNTAGNAPAPVARTVAAPAKPAPAPAPVKVAAAVPVAAKPAAQAAAPAPAVAKTADDNVRTASLKADPAPDSGPSFRWPVRGRVISAYGAKTSGSTNDGINLAVPEGTEVKASDDGVVAYAGSELKGFGNLVLIRHPNGWVTAYAHNSALEVKRGDTVRRGQIIAKSGSTGNVSSPQLHFEVRQGAKAVDPLSHLPSA